MLEVNAIYYILLIEAFVLALILILIGALVFVVTRRRRRSDIDAFASRLARNAAARDRQSLNFLQIVYELEDVALESALSRLKAGETRFLEALIQCLYKTRSKNIELLSEALELYIESCKSLPPPKSASAEVAEAPVELLAVRQQNEALQVELANTQQNLDELTNEFGEIFGGGKNHELTLEEITARVNAIKAGKLAGS